ncbi:MAG: hypothetical protein HKN19_18235 [Halioglobus sp.]|nr:hypothetical protein [Halioglobus sp.]
MKKARLVCLLVLTLVLTSVLAACSSTRYYYQIAHGHLSLLATAEPVEDVLAVADPEVAAALELVQGARTFAKAQLGLSFNDSYTSYVDLGRDYVVQNLYVAPEFSTQLHSWCYWIIGCANYRGFFDAGLLEKQRDSFGQRGFDTYVSPVTAYSTLGWFDDPVLSTFVDLPDYRLFGLIIHELAHQHLYVEGDTFFNESFAMAVERAGMARFYQDAAKRQLTAYHEHLDRVSAITDLAIRTRTALEDLYRQRIAIPEMRRRKTELLEAARRDYGELTGRTDAVFNNASLGAVAAYNKYVAAFEAMLAAAQGDLPRFYAHARRLGGLAPLAREECLEQWLASTIRGPAAVAAPCRAVPPH